MSLSPLITQQIAPQNFELIRDRIGEILMVEFANQKTYSNNADITPTRVEIEGFVDIDEDNFPLISIHLYDGKYEKKDYGGDVPGEYCFYIDIYTGAPSTSDTAGDQVATVNLVKMVGMVRAILDNPVYGTLAFDPSVDDAPDIRNTHIEDFFINIPRSSQNAIDFICGRLRFMVTVPETSIYATTTPSELGSTIVTLYNSGRQYHWGVTEPTE